MIEFNNINNNYTIHLQYNYVYCDINTYIIKHLVSENTENRIAFLRPVISFGDHFLDRTFV